KQDVANFNAGVKELATRLAADEALTGALVVGRFKDGSPVTLRPWDGLGPVNNFEYLAHDRVGNRCPFHAHIRKANQRGGEPVPGLGSGAQPSNRAPRDPVWSPACTVGRRLHRGITRG